MSISNEILRIQTAKENLKSSIQRKDVTVPSTTKIDGYPPLVDSIGGGEEDPEDAVRFFDYDGTLLYQYSAAEFLQLSAMPANPSHTGLVAQGWNWSLEDAQEFVAEWGYQDIGQMYITESGDTEIDVEFPEGFKRLSPYLRIAVNGTVEIDWGDDSAVETVTGTGLSTRIDKQHTYASTGTYTIVIHVVNGSFCFYTNSTTYTLLHNNQNSQDKNRVYANRIKAIRIGNGIDSATSNFECCSSLCSISVPKISISMSFKKCYSLSYITLPNTSSICSSFSECYSLKNISFSKQITSISGETFRYCYSLFSLIIPIDGRVDSAYRGRATDSGYSRPFRLIVAKQGIKKINRIEDISEKLSSMTTVSNEYFGSIDFLKEIIIPDTIQSIDSYAFYNCVNLEKIVFPSSITNISGYILSYTPSLTTIQFLGSVTSIESAAFWYCYSLSSFEIPNSVTKLNSMLFSSCYNLHNIILPSGITSIDYNVFQNCYSLPKLTIPSGVTSIGSSAFYGCYGLSELTIPANVTLIGTQAFYNCYGMKEYHFLSTTPPTITNTNVFSGIPSDCIIYVPQGCLEAYQTAQYWSTYASYMQEEPTQTR